jgi:hypothetical protein
MSPAEVDDLPDEMWAAMVRRMVVEADALKANQAKLPTR